MLRSKLFYFCKSIMRSSTSNKDIKKNISNLKGFLSVNDLRDKEFNHIDLSPNERLAIKNFDRYRISILSQQSSEKDFHNSYMKLQVMANLTPYEEFLKEEYFT